jgi:hypothetical protein
MATTPISDYTNRDYDSFVASLLDVASLKLPEWTDRSENDLGRLILELFAYVGDIVSYYLDRVANEAFLATAVERRSVIDLLSLIGYTLDTPAPAAVELAVTPKSAAAPVHIDVGAHFMTQAAAGKPAVEFFYLPENGAPIDVLPVVDAATGLIQPIMLTALNASPVSSPLGQSNGLENQGFMLPQQPVILSRDPAVWDGLVVEVRSGAIWEQWERRTTLLYSLSNDPHFIVRVDENDAAEVIFGDGQYGRIPPLNAPVRARYLVGGGSAGNIAPDTVTVISSGVSVQATVTNPIGASGGADRESLEHARRNAPGVYRSQQRAVTADDFARLAESFPGVARAIAVAPAWDHTVPPGPTTADQAGPGLVSWNYIDLIVVATGGLNLTDQLRANLMQYFESRRMVTTILSIREPVFVSVDLTVEVGVEPTFYAGDVRLRAIEALEALFALDDADFGKPFYLSKVFEAVESIDGVAFADVSTFSGRRSYPSGEIVDPAAAAVGRIPLRPREFPREGTLMVTTTGGLA